MAALESQLLISEAEIHHFDKQCDEAHIRIVSTRDFWCIRAAVNVWLALLL